MGFQSLNVNTVDGNVAVGYQALRSNSSGTNNVATGFQALFSNTIGLWNVGVGTQVLFSNTDGVRNTAVGFQALVSDTGGHNTAVGDGAGSALTTGSGNIDIGNTGMAGESDTIRIGTTGSQTATYIAGIFGATAPSGAAVSVTADGKLGTVTSSARFKDAIKPMDKTSEAILALKPVTFRYKPELDPDGIPQFGLVAEDVEKVNPDLVVRDAKGDIYTVRYEAVNAMLLNEFLKEHQTVQELRAAAAKQEAMIAQQQKQIEALAAGLQKVSAKVELTKPAPQTVLNNQ